MKKRLFAVLTLLVFCMSLALPVSAQKGGFSIRVSPQSKEAAPGERVTFRIVAECEDLVALQFDVVIPEGLKYVSGSLTDGLAAQIGMYAADWTEDAMRFTCFNDVGVTVSEGTVLLTLECEVVTAGEHQVTVTEVQPYNSNFEELQVTVQADALYVASGSEDTVMPPDAPEEDATLPAVDTTQPVEDTTQPAVDTTQPVEDTTQPAVDATHPVEDTTSSIEDTTGPVEDMTLPAEDVTAPSVDITGTVENPTEDTTPPAADMTGKAPAGEGEASPDAEDSVITIGAMVTDESEAPEEKTDRTALWITLGAVAAAVAAAVFLLIRSKRKS